MSRLAGFHAAAATVLGAALALPAAGLAQARVIVAPTAAAGPVYDDNIFSAPKGQETADVIWRVTPGVSASRETARTMWFGNYSMDAELFRDHPDLTTPMARQTGSGFVKVQASTTSTFTLAGGYDNTITPSELNVATGLQLARVRGWRWHAGPELKHFFGPNTSITLAYDLSNESLSTGETVSNGEPLLAGRALLTQAGDVRIAHAVGARNEIQVGGFVREFLFDRETGMYSVGGLLGWGYKFTPYTKLTVLGGPRLLQNEARIEPEIDATLLRHARLVEVSLNYARTVATAVGLITPLKTQRIVGSASYRRVAIAEVGVQGGVYFNRDDRLDATVRTFRVAADMTRRLAGALSISASYSIDYQRGRLRTSFPLLDPLPLVLSTSLVPNHSLVLLPPAFIDSPMRHSTAMVRLTVSPRFRPTSKPREGAPDDHR
jgi:hypothetical protein